MPGFQDSAFLVLLALLLFGPKKLPVLARQLGKLMGDFRRASNEFRSQMEDELRISEQADRQKEIAKLEAAAPKPALMPTAETAGEHVPPPAPSFASEADAEAYRIESPDDSAHETVPAPLPIATSGELKIMPPATGLPVANTSIAPFLDSIPAVAESNGASSQNGAGSHSNGATAVAELPDEPGDGREQVPATNHSAEQETEARPWMI